MSSKLPFEYIFDLEAYVDVLAPYCILNNKIVAKYSNDSGSTKPLISESMALAAQAELKKLKNPVECMLAVDTEAKVHVEHIATLPIELRTPAGPVILRNVTFYVSKEPVEEVLIGNSLLKSLGIDVDAQMEKLAGKMYDCTDRKTAKELKLFSFEIRNGKHGLREYVEEEFDDGSDVLEVGPKNTRAEIGQSLEMMVEKAKVNGLPRKEAKRIRNLLFKHIDVFRFRLGSDGPAKVKPFEIKLKPGAQLSRPASRRYSPMHREFLDWKLELMAKYGLVEPNPYATTASAAHVVNKTLAPKDIKTDFRLVQDLRKLNAVSEPAHWPILNLETAVNAAAGAVAFIQIDFVDCFTQFPCTEETANLLSIMTDRKVYKFNRVSQGHVNSGAYCQRTLQECFEERYYRGVISYLDDILLWGKTLDELIDNLKFVLEICEERNLKLHASKCNMFSKRVKFCGRILSPDGVEQDPEKIAGLVDLPVPKTAADLMSFLAAANWLRNSIVDFSRLVNPLRYKLEQVLKKKGRTKRLAEGIGIEFTPEELECYERVKNRIALSVKLNYPNPDDEYVLMTDASSIGWGAVLLAIKNYDPNKPFEEQDCRALSFLGGTFKGSQLNWSVTDKECFAIVESVKRLDYMLIRTKPFRIATDHRNLVYLFKEDKEMKTTTSQRLKRWAINMMAYRYKIEHVAGSKNLWSDIISRWIDEPPIRFKRAVTRSMAADDSAVVGNVEDGQAAVSMDFESSSTSATFPENDNDIEDDMPLSDLYGIISNKPVNAKTHQPKSIVHPWENVIWPTKEDIYVSQQIHYAENVDRGDLRIGGDGYIYRRGKIWIPENDNELLVRFFVVAHGGCNGHFGIGSSVRRLSKHVSSCDLDERLAAFCRSCLLCLQCKGSKVIPRPWGRTVQANRPNQVLHFDYLYIGPSFNGAEYILVVKDGLSQIVDLVISDSANASVVAATLNQWIGFNGLPELFVSDRGSHFTGNVMKEMVDRFKLEHHFTTAYVHFSNGTVENVNRVIIEVFRTILKEMDLDIEFWPILVPVVMYALNHTARDTLGGRSPSEVFSGRESTAPIDQVFNEVDEEWLRVPKPTAEILADYAKLREAMDEIHRDVKERSDKRHVLNRKRQRGVKPINFCVGDFVLWSSIDSRVSASKLQVIWRGPYRVVDTKSDFVYVLEHLVTKKQHAVHASRMKFYHDKDLNITEEVLSHTVKQGMLMDVDKLQSIKWNPDSKRFEIQVSWLGFEDWETSWESFSSLVKDVPLLIVRLLESTFHSDPVIVRRLWKMHQNDLEKAEKKYSVVDLRNLSQMVAGG